MNSEHNIAICMLIHVYTEQQRRLIKHLSSDFDVYIHIDKKSSIDKTQLYMPKVYVYKEYPVYWGSYNQILATLFLFQTAYKKQYSRYILISGEDIPIRSNLEIKRFYSNNSYEYFEYSKLPRSVWNDNGGYDRVDFFYPNYHLRDSKNKILLAGWNIIERANIGFLIPLLKKFHIRRKSDLEYWGGTNWMDLTNTCMSELLEFVNKDNNILRRFRNTRCADEVFFHTIICGCLHDLQIVNKSLRYIDWVQGPEAPRILRISDYENIVNSDSLFARKFNQNIDNEIIERIYADIS